MDVKYVTPELSGLSYTCYLYAALDIYTRYKVGLILPKVDEAAALLALYHATEKLPFPVRYVQTDNGLEFQKRFHAKCQEIGVDHFYIHKSSPNENAVVERSFRTDEEEFFFSPGESSSRLWRTQLLVSALPPHLQQHPPSFGYQYAYSQGGYLPVP